MIKIVYSDNVNEKNSYIYRKASESYKDGNDVLLVVPEQEVLESESALFTFADSYSSKNVLRSFIDVFSFKRLSNDVFRTYGGLSYRYIGTGGKKVIMWKSLSSVSDMLSEYKGIKPEDMSVPEMMLKAIEEFKMYNVQPSDLESVLEKCEEGAFSKKIKDLAIIYAQYDRMISEKYDDPSDDLTRCAEKLKGKDYFKNKKIFINSFDGFTAQEALILERMIEDSDDIVITLAYIKSDKREMNTKIKDTDRLIRKLADKYSKEVSEEELSYDITKRDDLLYLSKNIWVYGKEKYPGKCESVRIIKCKDEYEEASFVASDIAKQVQCGARYRDIAIIARDTSVYEGIIDSELEASAIPYYISKRTGIMSTPEVRLIISALSAISRGYRSEDMISYMRCGLSPLSYDECDLLEEYVSLYRISGRRWIDTQDWIMNPDGFTAERNEETEKKLEIINSCRKRLVDPLEKLSKSVKERPTVKSLSIALYSFLDDLSVREKLKENAEIYRSHSEDSLADESAKSFAILMDSLDDLVSAVGEVTVGVKEYLSLLSCVLSEADIGKIPSKLDAVAIESAGISRKSGVKYVYIMGLTEGSFPKAQDDSGILSDSDREILLDYGIKVSPFADNVYYDELLYFYKAVSSASDKVTMTFSSGKSNGDKPSSCAVTNTLSLFDSLKIENFSDIPDIDKAYSLYKILEYSAERKDERLIRKLYESSYFKDIPSLYIPFDAKNDCISEENARRSGNNMGMSETRIEQYVKCPFSYHCKYYLGLNDSKSGSFEKVDLGNFVHKVLELYFSEYREDFLDLDEGKVKEYASQIVDDYVFGIFGDQITPKASGLIKKLKRLSIELIMTISEEFRNSDFVPAFFELPLGLSDSENSVDPPEFVLEDGGKVTVYGKIDRVDVYKNEGKTYLRIIDYKSGNKKFDMKKIEKGLDMQMLIYLFALSSGKNNKFKKMIGDGEIIPAGIMYVRCSAKNKSRSGYLISDPLILDSMEHGLNGIFIPVKDKKGEPSPLGGSMLYTLEELGDLKENIESTIKNIASRIRSGDTRAIPLKDGDSYPCSYCSMKSICRVVNPEQEKETDE